MKHQHSPTEDMLTGDEVCTGCGIVLGERILDYTPRFETDAPANSDPAHHLRGLGSTFSPPPYPRSVTPEQNKTWRRLWHLSRRLETATWRERSARDAMVELGTLCQRLGLPKTVREEIAHRHQRLAASGKTEGRNRQATLAALTGIVCKERGIRRTPEEIARATSGYLTVKTLRKSVGSLRTIVPGGHRRPLSGAGYRYAPPQPDPRLEQIGFANAWKRFFER